MRLFSLSSTEVAYYCSPSFQTAFLYQPVFTCVVTLTFISFLSCQVSSHNIHQWKIDHFLKCFSHVTFTAVQLDYHSLQRLSKLNSQFYVFLCVCVCVCVRAHL
jgi:hypothetical protein